ncbi:MAG: hypothetical protein JW810_08405 [Sedimentisphaerales bacterium]|nr:hypothetical protein [Sedimentisphaerales bacterium]
MTLFDFEGDFPIPSVPTSDAQVEFAAGDSGRCLRIRTGHEKSWPGVTLAAPQGKWDLTGYATVTLDVKNVSDAPVSVYCRVDNPGADGVHNCVTGSVTVAPGQIASLSVDLHPSGLALTEPLELIGMRGYPRGYDTLKPDNITQLVIFVNKPQADGHFEIDNLRAAGRLELYEARQFIPFIDEFGQFRHKDWPGKVHSLDELKGRVASEEEDLAAHPGPADRDRYGGWSSGPQLNASGFFRVAKHQGKWWLVDPEGRLFWSHGIDCVNNSAATPISDREDYFAFLPAEGALLGRFYGGGSWAPHGYYQDHSPYKTYDFCRANLLRKYGPDWQKLFAEITHRRLRSWGLNTIANWSDGGIYRMRRTPYVASIHSGGRLIEGSEGYWGKFYDVFDPSFRQDLRRRLAAEGDQSAGDPWCIGYFVHNEIAWGDDLSLAVAALQSGADQPAKIAFLRDLRAKYETIEALNSSWDTQHASWDALLSAQEAPDRQKARDDLAAFYTRLAETYFRIVREEVKRVAPDQLYLGCRFAWVNDRAARAATRFCDVVSYNRYEYSVEDHRLPDGIDLPTIIGEFHFGALDRGMFHTGLKKTADQQDRSDTYARYVQGALRNPYIVGTHWFQYKDQATTGRGDGENYQIGFVDIADSPYPEIVRAARQVGYGLYEYRLNN